MVVVANTRRPRTRGEHRHLSLVPNTGVANTGAPNTGAPNTGAPNTGAPNTGANDSGSGGDIQPALWEAHELRRLSQLRRLAVDTEAPHEAIRLIENAASAEEAINGLSAAGLLPDETESFDGMLSWFTPLLEPGCDEVEAEIAGGGFIGELRRAAPDDVSVAEVLTDVVPQLVRHPRPESLAMARALAAIGPPGVRLVAASVADKLAAAGLADMPWANKVGKPRPVRFFGYGDMYGDQQSVVSVFSYDKARHAIVVLIDHLLGGGIKDCYLVEYTEALRQEYRAAGRLPGLQFRDYDAGTARAMLESALARQPCPVEPDQIEDVWNCIDVLRARVDLLPGPASAGGKADRADAGILPTSRQPATKHPASKQPASRQSASRQPASKQPSSGRSAAKRTADPSTIHRLKVTMRGFSPPIWRRFEVPSDITLKRLHTVIQLAFGWDDYHLFVFETPAGQYGSYDPDLQIRSATGKKLSAVADSAGDKIRYEYDFGDRWELDILVEATHPAEPDVAYPRCIAGRRAGPPEDCGGVSGFYRLIEVLADPGHEDHADQLEWLGIESAAEFDPEAFDPVAADRKLRRHARVLIRS
jgi:Plasmid pRiA4b ORF-3-like protein